MAKRSTDPPSGLPGLSLDRRRFLQGCAAAAGSAALSGCLGRCGGGGSASKTVEFWYSYGGRNRKVTEELIRRFNASHPDMAVHGTYQGDYFEALAKLRLAARTSSGPDVTHVIGEALPELWRLGLLEPLEPWATGAKGGPALERDDFLPALSQDGYFDYLGQPQPLFALPFNRSTPIAFYNERLLAEAAVKPPGTWDELQDAAARLTKRKGDTTKVWGFEVPVSWWFWYALLHQAGGKLLSPDGSKATFGGPEGQAALQLLVDMTQTQRTMKHPPGRDFSAWEVANTDFLSQKVAMIWTSTAFLRYFQENASFSFGTAFLPGKVRRAVPTGGTFFVMLKRAPAQRKRAAWTFLHWMCEPEQTAYWARETGYMPVRKSALELPESKAFYAKHPSYRTTLDQLQHAVTFPFTPPLLEIERKLVQPNLEGPVIGRGDASQVLGKAAEEADRLLASVRPGSR